MQNKIEYILLKILSNLITKFPLNISRKIAKLIGSFFYYLIPIRKEVVIKNLKIAFPYLSDFDISRLTKKSYQNLFIILIEILYLPRFNEDILRRLVKIKNVELIEQALKRDKGLIFVSAHFGNWEILAIASALILKQKFTLVIKPLRNPIVDEFINSWRTKFGNEIIPLGISVKNVFKRLLQKNIIALLADQRASINSLEMDFFGRKTHVYEGPATLSIKTGAPLIFAIAIRQPDYSYHVELKEIKIDNKISDQENITHMTAIYISYLEDYIRQYPEQWLWFHNRWKH